MRHRGRFLEQIGQPGAGFVATCEAIEPGLALRRVRGQHVLEATEGLALLQRLPKRLGEAVIAALIDDVLHDAEGLGRPDGFDEQPAVVVAGILVGLFAGIGSDQEQDRPGLDVQPVAALPERVARVQRPAQFLEVDGQHPGGIARVAGQGAVRAHLDIPKASHKNW